MQISSLKIRNYRGLSIDIDNINEIAIVIGQNDTGKTNICSAILKVLDYNRRRIPFTITDSTNSNKEDIEIEVTLTADDLDPSQLAIIGNYIHLNGTQKYIRAKLTSKYNEDTMEYEDTLLYGDSELDYQEVKINTQTQLDKILSIVYIDPVYDIESCKKEFFKFQESNNKENERFFTEKISSEIAALNQAIQDEEIIGEIQNELNQYGNFDDLLDDVKFKVTPNIKEDNIYKSLNISTYDANENEFSNIGDGKNKIFSMILKSKIHSDDKKKIFIIEEPENHLYVLLQRVYISALLKMEPSQLIITTHSPYTIDFEKTKQIIKISQNHEHCERKIYSFNNINNEEFKKYGYLINVEVAEMLYYDNVLLIEGDSEKYFYSLLMSRDPDFLKLINKKRFGICAVGGIAFKKVKEMFETLGINVYIKTDNDIFKVPRKQQYRYAGLERCIEYLSENTKEELCKLLNSTDFKFRIENENERLDTVEENIGEICKILYNEHIIFSKHHDGFEGDFYEYIRANPKNEINEDDIYYLKKAKLKNLHEFIEDYNIDITVNGNNKSNELVRFLYE